MITTLRFRELTDKEVGELAWQIDGNFLDMLEILESKPVMDAADKDLYRLLLRSMEWYDELRLGTYGQVIKKNGEWNWGNEINRQEAQALETHLEMVQGESVQ